jgi:hypothetical protein
MSHFRLVTQNLLASAAQAVSGVPSGQTILDLSSLINTVCFSGGIQVLGDREQWRAYADQSPLIGALMSEGLINVNQLEEGTLGTPTLRLRCHLTGKNPYRPTPRWREKCV